MPFDHAFTPMVNGHKPILTMVDHGLTMQSEFQNAVNHGQSMVNLGQMTMVDHGHTMVDHGSTVVLPQGEVLHFLCAKGVGNLPIQKIPQGLAWWRGVVRLGID